MGQKQTQAQLDAYDEIAEVDGGTLYRRHNIVWVMWDEVGRETWTAPSVIEAKRNFLAMLERWAKGQNEGH